MLKNSTSKRKLNEELENVFRKRSGSLIEEEEGSGPSTSGLSSDFLEKISKIPKIDGSEGLGEDNLLFQDKKAMEAAINFLSTVLSANQQTVEPPENPFVEKLRKTIEQGSVLLIGACIREGFKTKKLNEWEIEVLCKSIARPQISLYQFYTELEGASQDDKDSITMGQVFLSKLAMSESSEPERPGHQEQHVFTNSLASSFSNQTKAALLTKRPLKRPHVIEPSGIFPKIDLVQLFTSCNLVGDSAFSQMTNFLTRVFKNVLSPKFQIWYYTFRPKCFRSTDKHFEPFPDVIAENLIDFAHDVIGTYLPNNLIHGPIDVTDAFLKELDCENPEEEVKRRRNDREMVAQAMQGSIGQMINYLRDYHYNVTTGELENCKIRKSCKCHLTWRDLKVYRENCRRTKTDFHNFEPKDLIGYANQTAPKAPPIDGKLDINN